ncbi:hypothetical protein RCH19_000379 [Flavobacterium sp. PL12]
MMSTEQAVNPTNVISFSKRIAEKYVHSLQLRDLKKKVLMQQNFSRLVLEMYWAPMVLLSLYLLSTLQKADY